MLSLEERNDSWQNLLSGLGTGRDKSTYTHLSPSQTLSADYLEHLYLNDDIAARICELIPYEMLRQGFSIKIDDEEFLRPDLIDVVRDALVKARRLFTLVLMMGKRRNNLSLLHE